MTYNAIVFDMDGVLLTGYQTDFEIYRRAVVEALQDFATDETEAPDQLVDPDDTAAVRRTCEDLGVLADSFWGYREHAATVLENEQIANGGRQPFDDAPVLETLEEDYQLGVVSNNRQGTVRFVVDYFDWGSGIDAFHGRHPTLEGYDRMKPDPYYLTLTLEDLDVDPAETLYVGDRYSDVTTADRAGTDVALLARGDDPPAGDLEPTIEIGSLFELGDIAP